MNFVVPGSEFSIAWISVGMDNGYEYHWSVLYILDMVFSLAVQFVLGRYRTLDLESAVTRVCPFKLFCYIPIH